jgi:hypothetical protein
MATSPTGPITGPMAKGAPIQVYIKAKLDPTTHKICFDHEWELLGDPIVHKGDIDIPAKTPSTDIFFHLRQNDDTTGLNLRFCTPATEAMYVDFVPTCPTVPGNGGQITFPHAPSNRLLMVENANSGNACDLRYALRFNGDPNTQGGEVAPYAYDPDFKNGGGGGTKSSSLSAGLVILAFAAGAALGSLGTYISLQA